MKLTLSYEEGNIEEQSLLDLNEYIEETYPSLHADPLVDWEIVHNFRKVKRDILVNGQQNAQDIYQVNLAT